MPTSFRLKGSPSILLTPAGSDGAAQRPDDKDMASTRVKTTKTSGTNQAERLQASSLQRREQQKENLRGAILAAAGELFLEQGYEAFSMRQVAERIGYSATTIYRYYEDKDDLLFAIVHEGFTEFQRALVAALSALFFYCKVNTVTNCFIVTRRSR